MINQHQNNINNNKNQIKSQDNDDDNNNEEDEFVAQLQLKQQQQINKQKNQNQNQVDLSQFKRGQQSIQQIQQSNNQQQNYATEISQQTNKISNKGQQQSIINNVVGPQKPQKLPDPVLGYQSSSDEDDDQVLVNDPIYKQVHQNQLPKSNNNQNNQQNQNNQKQNYNEVKNQITNKKPLQNRLQRQNNNYSSSSDEDDDKILQNDPIFQQSKINQLPKTNLQAQSLESLNKRIINNDYEDTVQSNNNDEPIQNQFTNVEEKKNEIANQEQEEDQQNSEDSQTEIQNKYYDQRKEPEHIDHLQILEQYKVPINYEAFLRGHTKTITTLSMDQLGSRLVSGSNDYFVRFWDFNGMTKSMNAFRIVQPLEAHPIRQLSYSCDSQNILVVAGGQQVCLLNKDARRGHESVKGDMYLSDMNQTKGHVSMVNSGLFSPNAENWFATGSSDATVRLWDINKRLYGIELQMAHTYLIKCIDDKGNKTIVDTVQYSPCGQYVFAGCRDGSIQGFSTSGHFHRAQFICGRGWHQPDDLITSIQFLNDGGSQHQQYTFVTRSINNNISSPNGGGSLFFWDQRQLKRPLQSFYNLYTNSPGSKLCISPDKRLVVTGVQQQQDQDTWISYLVFFDSKEMKEVARISICDDQMAISDIIWHPKINQIFVATGDVIRVLFDSKLSQKGALQCISKQPRQKRLDEIEFQKPIYAPHTLPSLREPKATSTKKQLLKQQQYEKMIQKQKDNLQSLAEHDEIYNTGGPGKGGKIGPASTVTQYLMRAINKAPDKREDPQEALTRLQPIVEKNPLYVINAYKDTQPKAIFDDQTPEIQEQQFLEDITEYCKHCGLKICTCAKRIQFEYKKIQE